MSDARKDRSKIRFWILLSVASYISISLFLTQKQPQTKWYTFPFTLTPSLKLDSNTFTIQTLNDFESINLHLNKPAKIRISSGNQTSKEINFTQWINLTNNQSPYHDHKIDIRLQNPNQSRLSHPYYINKIQINGKDIDNALAIKEFIHSNSISVSYPLGIENLSSTIAIPIKYILKPIFIFLLLTGLYQILLVSTTIVPTLRTAANQPSKLTVLVDNFSENSAVFTGFLATIGSLWVGISEIDNLEIDIYYFINQFKVALSTTVLGVGIKLLTITRKHLVEILK